MEIVTTDTILNYLKECVEHKLPVDAHTWLDAAQKLTMLLGDEHDRLFDLQQIVATLKVKALDDGQSSIEAKTRVETTLAFVEMQKQKAKIGRIEEMVRIAKIQARMKDTEMRT